MTHALIGNTALRNKSAFRSTRACFGNVPLMRTPLPDTEFEDAGELYDIEELVLFIDSADSATRSRKFVLYAIDES